MTPDWISTGLRIGLFLGMLLHKLVWEVMKISPTTPREAVRKPARFGLKSAVKLLKSFVLLFLVVQTLFLTVFPISPEPLRLQIVGTSIYLIGLSIAILSRFQLGKNWANLEDAQVLPEQSLVQEGIYAYIRHPIYTGDILLVLGLELALNSWLVLIVLPLIVVVVRQTLAEETRLALAFPGYSSYRQKTKMFVPYIV
jgi:protein-S-isoprenylcysteine O-methyltransferase Ste14